jgi:hypothetical protein
MKRLTTIAFLILTLGIIDSVSAQVQVTLTLPNIGSPYLSDYISHRGNRVLTLTNLTGQQQSIYLHGKVEQIGAPGYYIRTKQNYRPAAPIVLEPNETKTLFARDEDWAFVEDRHLEDNIPATERRHIITSGILTEGEYQVCVQAIDFFTNRPVSPPEPAGCLFFVATLGSPPQIVQPSSGEVIDQEYPMISWIPAVIMQPRDNILYDLYVVELTSRALNPAEVVEQSILYRGGNPFVLENLRQPFYQILPGDPRLKAGSRYAIVVVAKDSRGSAQFENQGRSEIIIVDIASPEDDEEEDDLIVIGPPVDEGIVSLLPMSHLQGRLLYRFHEDAIGGILTAEPILMPFNSDNLMPLQAGNSLQNMGFEIGIGDPGDGALLPVDEIVSGWYPSPPQYMLPAGYNTHGGKPLKQAGIRFTARYAVGKKPKIEHPEDLQYVGTGAGLTVTGAILIEPLTILNDKPKVIASATTDNDGNYSVSFLADETFGMLASGPVNVQHYGQDPSLYPPISGYGLYRVITMEVEEKWYCHPDIVIFLQPGQSLEVPTQVVTVQSYNLKVEVRSGNVAVAQAAPWNETHGGTFITDATVKLGRFQHFYDNVHPSFPKDESNIGEYGHPWPWNGGGLQRLVTDSLHSGASGIVTFYRLVKHDGIGGCEGMFGGIMAGWPSDGYVLESVTHPTMSIYHYYKDTKTQVAPCPARLASKYGNCPGNECAPRSADYIPPTVTEVHELWPRLPKLYVESFARYGVSKEPLRETNLNLYIFDNDEQYHGSRHYFTDDDGFRTVQFTWDMMPTIPKDVERPKYLLTYWKSGFKNVSCSDCGSIGWGGSPNNLKALRMGDVWDVDIELKPGSFVRGRVVDEHGQPIYGRVKIGDGPWVDFSPEWETPQDEKQLFQPGWQHFDFQLQQGSSQMQQHQDESFTTRSQQALQNYSNIVEKTEGGYQVEYHGNIYVSKFAQKGSIFETTAPYGPQIEIIIEPSASNYFPDTLYVDIPQPGSPECEGPVCDIGTFVIKERLKRPRIEVVSMGVPMPVYDEYGNPIGTQETEIPVEEATVLLSNLPAKTTDENGIVRIPDFGSPSNQFLLRVEKEGYTPYIDYPTIPATKEPYDVKVVIGQGKTVTGTVTRAADEQPIEGARIYAEVDNNEYGAVLIQTYSNADGTFALHGVPVLNKHGLPTSVRINAAKTDDTAVTYIGKSVLVPVGIYEQDFQLEEAPFLLTHIWNLPVDLESVEEDDDNWIISGAFVDLPPNERFRPEVETQRLPFKDIIVQDAGPSGVGEKISVEPGSSSITTTSIKFRSILNEDYNGGYTVEMSGTKKTMYLVPQGSSNSSTIYPQSNQEVSVNEIQVTKDDGGNGHVKTRAYSGLDYMRFTYEYTGQFFLGETPQSTLISAYKGTADVSMPESYYLMPYDNHPWAIMITAAIQPDFYVHKFKAVIDPNESYVRADTFAIATKLIVELPEMVPPQLIVNAGHIYVLHDKITVLGGNDSSLEFKLETWQVITGPWDFDPDQGGLVTFGVIYTDLLDFQSPEILIRPDELIIPEPEQIGVDKFTFGGVLDLHIQPTAKVKFGYPYKNKYDPDEAQPNRWRVVASHPQQGQPAARFISMNNDDIPGWPGGTEVGIRFIENFSGPEGPKEHRFRLTMASNQEVNHYHVLKQKISRINLNPDGVQFTGNTDLGIPNMNTGEQAHFIYSKEQGEIIVRVQSLNTSVETRGKVAFIGDSHFNTVKLDWGHFEDTGDLRIYDDNDNEVTRRTHHPDKKRLRAKLIKRPNNSNSCGSNAIDICIEIIDVDGGHLNEGNQKQLISLGEGNDGWKKVLQGSQHVVGNNWNELTYQAQFEGFGPAFEPDDNGTPANIMWFRVAGDIETDLSKGDEIRLNNIETPFGGLELRYNFDSQELTGSLNLQNVYLGAVNIVKGNLEMRMGARGFYLAAQVDGIYPTIGDIRTNLIVGYYPHALPYTTQQLLTYKMRSSLPAYLDDGIKGLFFSANKSYGYKFDEEQHENTDYNPDDETDDSGGFYIVKFNIEAGVDARMGVNFGSPIKGELSGAYFDAIAYGEVMVSVNLIVCNICFGAFAELAFQLTMSWNPVYLEVSACGTVGLEFQICPITINPSARVTLVGNTNDGVTTDLSLKGLTCAGFLGGDKGAKDKDTTGGLCPN